MSDYTAQELQNQWYAALRAAGVTTSQMAGVVPQKTTKGGTTAPVTDKMQRGAPRKTTKYIEPEEPLVPASPWSQRGKIQTSPAPVNPAYSIDTLQGWFGTRGNQPVLPGGAKSVSTFAPKMGSWGESGLPSFTAGAGAPGGLMGSDVILETNPAIAYLNAANYGTYNGNIVESWLDYVANNPGGAALEDYLSGYGVIPKTQKVGGTSRPGQEYAPTGHTRFGAPLSRGKAGFPYMPINLGGNGDGGVLPPSQPSDEGWGWGGWGAGSGYKKSQYMNWYFGLLNWRI